MAPSRPLRFAVCALDALVLSSACGDPDEVTTNESATSQQGGDAPKQDLGPVDDADLRPEARPLADLTDPVDRLLVELYANEYLDESANVARQVVRARSLVSELSRCLVDLVGFGGSDSTLVASALIDSRFAFQHTNGDVVEIFPEEAERIRSRAELDPDAPQIAQSACVGELEASSKLIYGGEVSVRAADAEEAGTWVDPAGVQATQGAALRDHCPAIVSGDLRGV